MRERCNPGPILGAGHRLVVCKIVTCVPAMAIIILLIFLEIVKSQRDNSCCRSGHSALQATRRMPLWALAFARARTQDYLACWTRTGHDFLLTCTCHSVQRARQPLSRRAISLGSFTVAGDFMLQVIRLESLGSELQES